MSSGEARMRERLLTSAREAMAAAQAAGAPAASVSTWWRRSLSVKHRERRIEKLQESTSMGLSLSVYLDGRFAVNTTNDLRPEQLQRFVGDAVATARYTSADPHRTLPDPALYEGQADVDLLAFDGATAGLTFQEMLPRVREAEEAALTTGGDAVISVTASGGMGHVVGALVQSNGFEGTRESSSVYVGASVTVRDEGERRPAAGSYASARAVADLPEASGLGDDGARRALDRRGEAKVSTRVAPMVVENRAARRLVGRLTWPLMGRALQQRRSMFEGRLGKKLFNRRFSLVDDPHIFRGLGSRLYDGEGIATRRRPVFDNGKLRSYFIDTYYGNKLGTPATSGGTTNLVVTPGKRDPSALIAAAEGGIYVQGFLGGNADSTTGDFSFGIRGRLIEGGQLGARVNEMNATGNLIELFGNFVEAADDPYPYSSLLCPTLSFADVQLSGV